MPTKKSIKLSHNDIRGIIDRQAAEARELALEQKRINLGKDPKKAQQISRKPIAVLKKTFETEKQIVRDRRRKGVTMISIVKETLELTKEFATLKSPVEVYIFVAGVWLTGVGIGAILG
jgi:hypothetical protein